MKYNKGNIAFKKTGIFTLLAVYLLILVGSIVRTTGSGMGCPDWPKCFGRWVPPTEETQLPENYQELYAAKRKQKNIKLAGYLEAFGYSELSNKIAHDPEIYKEPEFNAVKTWIEYINRLVGALIGFLVLATFYYSTSYWKKDKLITLLTALAVVMVGFEGWLGSIVVSTNLLPIIITIHMAFAIFIVAVLIYVLVRANSQKLVVGQVDKSKVIKTTLYLLLLLTFAQTMLGTQVREQIDAISYALGFDRRNTWIEQLGIAFYIHRSFSILIFLGNIYLLYMVFLYVKGNNWIKTGTYSLMIVLAIEILTGVVMAYFNIPAVAQSLHLILAVIALGLQFFILQVLRYLEKKQKDLTPFSIQFA